MRNITRISRLTEKLKDVWELTPDLRFNQLIEIINNESTTSTFYLEDDKFEENIDKWTTETLTKILDEEAKIKIVEILTSKVDDIEFSVVVENASVKVLCSGAESFSIIKLINIVTQEVNAIYPKLANFITVSLIEKSS